MKKIASSFRDPDGNVFIEDDTIYRTVRNSYRANWELCEYSGLYNLLSNEQLLIDFSEIDSDEHYKLLKVKKIPFISYPYEWCFSQLKDAARTTLSIQKLSLEKGLTLKDSSAYNVQFINGKPIFIDLLSFEKRPVNSPWQAYRQFCMHFYAPLVLTAKVGLWCGQLSKLNIDGVPLSSAVEMLPLKSKLNFHVGLHLVAHSKMEDKYSDSIKSADKAISIQISPQKALNLIQSLESAIDALSLPKTQTTWGDYYDDTNYAVDAMYKKEMIVHDFSSIAAKDNHGKLALDFGANTGKFSELISEHFSNVIATDIDPLAVERHYQKLQKKGPNNILPLIIDFANPSPALGWASKERDSFSQRSSFGFITALAVIHHLRITNGIPLEMQAEYFSDLLDASGYLCIEFVPKEDSQIRRMLAVRSDVFYDYTEKNFQSCFEQHFDFIMKKSVSGSLRTIYLLKKKPF
ncbi:class I SAM-dependent methyltransferase [Maridesulfovibrio sp.]|uniref:class I SAM-dependent methyltransferase n=1 Tax=Maridesulfovibrio sp. TaxID=2795000 RepID=UPI0029C9C56F|nr:class I SAM-dependent methyltransferase [Maridesulfovibrio sp.]